MEDCTICGSCNMIYTQLTASVIRVDSVEVCYFIIRRYYHFCPSQLMSPRFTCLICHSVGSVSSGLTAPVCLSVCLSHSVGSVSSGLTAPVCLSVCLSPAVVLRYHSGGGGRRRELPHHPHAGHHARGGPARDQRRRQRRSRLRPHAEKVAT